MLVMEERGFETAGGAAELLLLWQGGCFFGEIGVWVVAVCCLPAALFGGGAEHDGALAALSAGADMFVVVVDAAGSCW